MPPHVASCNRLNVFVSLPKEKSTMTYPKRYIVWSTNHLDLNDPFQKLWYLRQVLTKGRAADVAELNWDELKSLLPRLDLPPNIRLLWEDYFAAQG